MEKKNIVKDILIVLFASLFMILGGAFAFNVSLQTDGVFGGILFLGGASIFIFGVLGIFGLMLEMTMGHH